MQKTIALIGHSAAGKSSCLDALKIEPAADMDVSLGTRTEDCPTLDQGLRWILEYPHDLVVVSNHEQMLKSFHEAKRGGDARFAQVHFLYLKKPRERLRRHLKRSTLSGSHRPKKHQEYTLAIYDRFDQMFSELADEQIDCSSGDPAEISRVVRGVRCRIRYADVAQPKLVFSVCGLSAVGKGTLIDKFHRPDPGWRERFDVSGSAEFYADRSSTRLEKNSYRPTTEMFEPFFPDVIVNRWQFRQHRHLEALPRAFPQSTHKRRGHNLKLTAQGD
ncbi:hypothetical protein [Fuerstiella marisgermanici]|uniref:Uncharacterized protein n=1 Tax=Fuerstiella marisgermanici TaxID=1891926 RepID=A0A1P8WGT6_9PLAN|nr:hypothetical protein [Fuerstiella marisgermanici]APZ93263.1 hypothetical protein Fuma_02880 [Fuerstiella marisgermanici]